MDQNRPNHNSKDSQAKLKTGERGSRGEATEENGRPSQNASKVSSRQTDKKPDALPAAQQAKSLQPTADQLRIAQMFQGPVTSDSVMQEKVSKVQELTDCSADEAVIALHDTGHDTEAAINLLLEGGSDKNTWETTGRKGKKARSKKVQQESEASKPFGLETTRGAQRGRPANRAGASRGGRGGVNSTPRNFSGPLHDDSSNTVNGSRGAENERDRLPFPASNRRPENQENQPRDGTKAKNEQEHFWGEDTDDDWKENIRETKVFTRSSTTVPSPSALPFSNQSSQPTPAVGTGPTFSAMVQKQAAASAAWSNSGTSPSGNIQRPSTDSWSRQAGPAPSLATQKPSTSSTLVPESTSHISTLPGGIQSSSSATSEETKGDLTQLGLQFGNLTFNRSMDTEASQQRSIPSQSQTYSSRQSFANVANSHQPSPAEFGASRNDASHSTRTSQASTTNVLSDLAKSQSPQLPSGSSFGGLPQSHVSSGSRQDDTTNTYSARNIQSSAGLSGTAAASKIASSFGESSSGLSHASAISQQSILPNLPSSLPDARFGTQQNASGLSLAKTSTAQPASNMFQQQQRTQPVNQGLQSANSQSLPQQQQSQYQQQQTSPSGKSVTPGVGSGFSSSYGSSLGDSVPRNANSLFSSNQAGGQSSVGTKDLSPGVQQQQQQHQQSSAQQNNLAPQRASNVSSTTSVFAGSMKPIPSVSMSSKSPYGSSQAQSMPVLNQQQQQYLQQQQQQYNQQQNPMTMFPPQMYSSGLEGMSDPRLQSVIPGMPLEYSYQNSLSGRDLGYTTPDHNKYRGESAVGGHVQVSQQQALVGQHLGQYPFVYSTTPVAQNYVGAQYPTQFYPNSPSGYPKGGGALGGSYPGNSYPEMSNLADIAKASSAYNAMRSANEPYAGNAGMLSGNSDLQASGYYPKQQPGNKYDNKPAFSLPQMGAQQNAAYGGQYFPVMPQQPLHQMGQGSPMSGQNVNNSNKQNKGPGFYQQWSPSH